MVRIAANWDPVESPSLTSAPNAPARQSDTLTPEEIEEYKAAFAVFVRHPALRAHHMALR